MRGKKVLMTQALNLDPQRVQARGSRLLKHGTHVLLENFSKISYLTNKLDSFPNNAKISCHCRPTGYFIRNIWKLLF
jgi:hypothetical protein